MKAALAGKLVGPFSQHTHMHEHQQKVRCVVTYLQLQVYTLYSHRHPRQQAASNSQHGADGWPCCCCCSWVSW